MLCRLGQTDMEVTPVGLDAGVLRRQGPGGKILGDPTTVERRSWWRPHLTAA